MGTRLMGREDGAEVRSIFCLGPRLESWRGESAVPGIGGLSFGGRTGYRIADCELRTDQESIGVYFTVSHDRGDARRAGVGPEQLDADQGSRSKSRVAQESEAGFGDVRQGAGDVRGGGDVEANDKQWAFSMLPAIVASILVQQLVRARRRRDETLDFAFKDPR